MKGDVKFCSKCGREVQRYRRELGFDPKTGKKVYSPEYVGCPQYIRGKVYTGHHTNEPRSCDE